MSAVVDLAAVAADEEFLSNLPADDELARVLAAWRRDVESEPFPVVSTSEPRLPVVGVLVFLLPALVVVYALVGLWVVTR